MLYFFTSLSWLMSASLIVHIIHPLYKHLVPDKLGMCMGIMLGYGYTTINWSYFIFWGNHLSSGVNSNKNRNSQQSMSLRSVHRLIFKNKCHCPPFKKNMNLKYLSLFCNIRDEINKIIFVYLGEILPWSSRRQPNILDQG